MSTIAFAAPAGRARRASSARAVRTAYDSVISVVALLGYATPLLLDRADAHRAVLGQARLAAEQRHEHDRRGLRRLGNAIDIGEHLVLPAVTLALFFIAIYTRLMRASMLEVPRHGLRAHRHARRACRARQVAYATCCATRSCRW